MSIETAAAAVLAVLKGVGGVRAYSDPGATVDPPATVLGPPSLVWESGCPDPTSARWVIYVVVAADDRALGRLWQLVPTVAAALDGDPNIAVLRADPGAYLTGGVELPCYEIQIEVSL